MTALDTATQLIQALDRSDPEAMRVLFAADAYWWVDTGHDRASGSLATDPGDDRPWPLHGRMDAQDKCDSLRGVRQRFPLGVRQHIRRAFADDSTAVIEVEGDGLFLGLTQYANRYAFVIEVVDNQVTAVREYLDTAHSADVFHGAHLDRSSVDDLHDHRHVAPASSVLQERAAAFLGAISAADGDAVLALCAPAATWWADTGKARGEGPEAPAQRNPDVVVIGRVPVTARAPRISNLRNEFPAGLTVAPVSYVESGNLLAVEARGDGVRQGGNRYQNRYVFTLGFDAEQQITEVREYCDTRHAFGVYDLDL